MSYAANAYAKTHNQAPLSPRELEAHVLLKCAARLQAVRDTWPEKAIDLDEALTKNRKLWTILVAGVSEENSSAPLDVKQNILNLGLFIFNHTFKLMATPEAEFDPKKLDVLVNINRQIAAGLRTAPEAGPQPPQAA